MAIQKCYYYLRGLPHFNIWTDHRPLLGVFDKALAALENARLMRMRGKIIPYTFKITWVAGKTHYIANMLSRYSVFGPAEDNFNVDTAIKCLRSLTAEPESLKSIYAKQNEAYKLNRAEKQHWFLQAVKRPPGKSIQKHPEQTLYRQLSLIHIWRCRRLLTCRSRWAPYH